MQQKIINMLEVNGKVELLADSRLSFKPFLNFLREHAQNKDSVKRELFEFVLNKFESFEHIDTDIELDQLPQYKELLDILYVVLTNLTEEEEKIYWGLCVPMTPTMFYGSDPFYEILDEANEHDMQCGLEHEEYEEFIQTKLENFYAYILEKFYHTRLPKKKGYDTYNKR